MTPSQLQRIAAAIVRMHGRGFAAIYGGDMLATLATRALDARRRGHVVFIAFAAHEILSLLWSAARQQVRPDWERPRPAVRTRRISADQIGREIRHGARRLMRAPAFSAAVVITLAMAIGANAAVFTLLSRIVLAPLPYPSAERLVVLDHGAPALGINTGMGMSIGLFREYSKLPSIEALALYTVREGTLSGNGDAMRIDFLQATPSIGALTGMQPQLGRWFTDAEGEAGAPNVAVLTEAMWRRRFGASMGVVGHTLRVDGTSYEIVGVLRGANAFPDQRVEFVVPLPLPRTWTRAAGFNYSGVARLTPNTSIDRARREQDAVIADMPRRYQSDTEARTITDGGLHSLAQPLKDSIVGDTTMTLWALLGAAALVLLMACANLANLFLIRYESKVSDLAVRRALGADQLDLAAHIASEAVLATAAGTAIGLWLASAAVSLIARLGERDLPRVHELRVDATAFVFTILIAGGTALFLSLLPLSRLWMRQPSPLMDSQRATTAAPSRMRTRQLLMAVQVALAVILLSAAGLMTRSFRNLMHVDTGFQSESRLTFTVNLPRSELQSRADAAMFHAALLDRLRALPGVNNAAATSTLPLDGLGLGDPLEVRGRVALAADATPFARFRRVSNAYFAAMDIPVRAGRGFDSTDADGRTDSVIVDAALARVYFGDRDPLGQQIRPIEGDPLNRWLTIVGVVGNTSTDSLSEVTPVPKMYVPLRGSMWADVPAPHDLTYVLHVSGDPLGYVDTVRGVLTQANPRVALARPERLDDVVARARASRALTMILLVIAAAVATGIGIVGVYAVISYTVVRRRTEIGVRIALGASPGQVTALIVRRSTLIIVAGILVGVACSLASAHLLRSLLFGVAPGDWLTHLATALAILSVGAIACWLPAWRATRMNPTHALRAE